MITKAAIVLGTGIKKDGTLPDSCLSNVKTAIDLYHTKKVNKIIFAGKWAWNCIYSPPTTEAQAMRRIAFESQISDQDIFVEDKSVTTVSNLCLVKENILIPNDINNVVLVCISDIIRNRNEYNLKMILGPEYFYEIVYANSVYTPEKYEELKKIEVKKLNECQRFYQGITPGDHKRIFRQATSDLKKNYINKQQP